MELRANRFFQKNAGPQTADWIETVKIHSESSDTDIDFVLCQNADTLLHLIYLGCIEINPWNYRVGSLECPGLHIYISPAAEHDYDLARQFAEIIANVSQGQLSKTTSLTRMPKKRQHRIYLDFLQNRHGQTRAAPYCVRPRPGATVSTRLEWKEVKPGLDPTKFTNKTIGKRAEKKGDLFKLVLKGKTNLSEALEKLERLVESTSR